MSSTKLERCLSLQSLQNNNEGILWRRFSKCRPFTYHRFLGRGLGPWKNTAFGILAFMYRRQSHCLITVGHAEIFMKIIYWSDCDHRENGYNYSTSPYKSLQQGFCTYRQLAHRHRSMSRMSNCNFCLKGSSFFRDGTTLSEDMIAHESRQIT